MQRDIESMPPGTLASLAAASEQEVARVMQVCNACRYCESFCAVFPAMTRRLEFGTADVHYLANLCHNCGACLHACQYAPPHEFAINVPRAMASVRSTTYETYTWPAAFGRLYRHAGLTTALSLAGGLALFFVLAVLLNGQLGYSGRDANFYAVFPHNFLVAVFGATFLFAVLALSVGAVRFWREVSPAAHAPQVDLEWIKRARSAAAVEAAASAATLRYLDGGHGDGCNEEDDRFTLARRRFHHLTFYGFLLCFASTSVATFYHYGLGLTAPYALSSLPVVLGTVGGVGLVVGPLGLLWLNLRRHPLHGDPAQKPLDRGFIALLFLVSLTGLVLLALRSTAAMPALLAVHLGTVMALFLTMPYGKFAHAVYRAAALLKYAIEKRLPNRLGLGGD
jgi:citrate/tricarballylate utilization protein